MTAAADQIVGGHHPREAHPVRPQQPLPVAVMVSSSAIGGLLQTPGSWQVELDVAGGGPVLGEGGDDGAGLLVAGGRHDPIHDQPSDAVEHRHDRASERALRWPGSGRRLRGRSLRRSW
ncbi:hypothetical protein [Micromonospora deserti]|uniref:hypothetical protein n=1 Tax=Micromonospora deserti TaxID=2070366 RepID=UPI00131409B8